MYVYVSLAVPVPRGRSVVVPARTDQKRTQLTINGFAEIMAMGDVVSIPGATGDSEKVRSITQYGVQPPNSSTALIVTDDRAQAEHALDAVTDGRVVYRTITYGDWLTE